MPLWLAILLIAVGATAAIALTVAIQRGHSRRKREAEARPAEKQPWIRGDWMRLGELLLALASVAIGIAGLLIDKGPAQPQPLPKMRIDLAASRFNPPGRDVASEEYVCLVNQGKEAIDVGGWVLRDSIRDVNTLPELTLPAKQRVRVHPGEGVDSASDIYGTSRAPAWNNQGDTVVLLDADGRKIDSRSYGPVKDGGGSTECGPVSNNVGNEGSTESGATPEGVGSSSHAEDSEFCSKHECIGDFTTQSGTIVECQDGTYSHAGGISSACSHHGGVMRE